MQTVNELIIKYNAPAYENIRQNLKHLPLLACYETEDGAFLGLSKTKSHFALLLLFRQKVLITFLTI